MLAITTRTVCAITLLSFILCQLRSEAQAADQSLVELYGTNAYIWVQMAARAAYNYHLVNEQTPPSISALIQDGYTPYIVPNTDEINFDVSGNHISCSITGNSYWRGDPNSSKQMAGMDVSSMEPPKEVSVPMGQGLPDFTYIRYSFAAQQFLDEGYNKQELKFVLNGMSIADFLSSACMDYLSVNGTLPDGLSDIENYIGAQRNPGSWDGINIVNDPGLVQSAAGNLYIGQNGYYNYEVSINLGNDVYGVAWESSDGNPAWALSSSLAYP